MDCAYCGYSNEHETELCARCGTKIQPPECISCGEKTTWGKTTCDTCKKVEISSELSPCPSCSAFNASSAEYCTHCGTPMAVITHVVNKSLNDDVKALDTWRVYGIETNIVGRDEELDILERIFKNVVEKNKVQCVSLTAPTGRGKSRLLAEFKQRLNAQFSEAHVSHAASRNENNIPYSMFARLLKDRFYIDEKDNPELAKRKLLDAIKYIVGGTESERVAHLVGELLNIHFDDSPHLPSIRDTAGAQDLDRLCYEALTKVLIADAEKDPLIIILEDLQYAPRRALDLISYVMKNLKDSRVFLVLTWAPQELQFDYFFADTVFDQKIELGRLSDEDIESFVIDTLRKAGELPKKMLAEIVRSAHGDPLTVEETLRILISRGIIDTRTKDWTIDLNRFEKIELPETVENAVHARLRSLSEEEQHVLQMAACVGNVFWPDLIRCLYRLKVDSSTQSSNQWGDGESEDSRCDRLLESLERKDIIRRHENSQIPDTQEMFFKHRLERHILYDELNPEDKKHFHQLTAQWLENKLPQNMEGIIDLIATHFDRAGAIQHAAMRYLEAAKSAQKKYQNEHAIDC